MATPNMVSTSVGPNIRALLPQRQPLRRAAPRLLHPGLPARDQGRENQVSGEVIPLKYIIYFNELN